MAQFGRSSLWVSQTFNSTILRNLKRVENEDKGKQNLNNICCYFDAIFNALC